MTRNGSKEQFGESDGDYALKTRRGFWRSRKGIITAVVIVVVIVGAVVGGAVGGTTKGSGGRPPGSSTGESSTSTSAAPAAATSGGSSNSAGSGGEAGQVQVSGPQGGDGGSFSHVFPSPPYPVVQRPLGLSDPWPPLWMYHDHLLSEMRVAGVAGDRLYNFW
ncbi:hypothetical protein EDC04DRAFT_277151 [Pisolithus marmoratus]|nr:hypothetical protein EDC04DRAFT_277151 [Pisolithus marmoratus]